MDDTKVSLYVLCVNADSGCGGTTKAAVAPGEAPALHGYVRETVAAEVGELVGAFVADVACVTFHPDPLDVVPGGHGIELAPELGVLDRPTALTA